MAEVPMGIELGTSSTRVKMPDSIRAAMAAKRPEVEAPAPKDCWRTRSLCVQLLIAYGVLSLVAFGALLGMSSLVVWNTSGEVVDTSRAELMNQIVSNAKLTLQDAGQVLDARLQDGFSVLVQPTLFAIKQNPTSGVDGRLLPLASFADTTKAHLKPPLAYTDRYRCISSVSDALKGCNAVTGLQEVSLSASSVYVKGSLTSSLAAENDGFDNADQGDIWHHINRTSLLDVFVRAAFASRSTWVSTFVAIDSSPEAIFRQYPGAVGSLAADSSARRTYSPTTRSWYTDTVGDALPADDPTTSYLRPFPMTILPPYIDAFGRGYLLTVAAPLSTGDGVAGADILVSALQDIVTTIKSRETGEAHLIHLSDASVVASRQISTAATATIVRLGSLALPGQPTLTYGDLSAEDGGSSLSGLGIQIVGDTGFVSDAAGTGSMVRWAGGKQYQLVWQTVWAGEYALLTCTSVDEIQEPIESQVAAIRTRTRQIALSSTVLCLIGLVFIFANALYISVRISRPVRSIVKKSNIIVGNIGGELFRGVKVAGRRPDEQPGCRDGTNPLVGVFVQKPGEVAALHGEFLRSLFLLNVRRTKAASPKTPFTVDMGMPPSAPNAQVVAASSQIQYPQLRCEVEKTDTEKRREELAQAPPVVPPLTSSNSMAAKICVKLLVPMVLTMAVIVGAVFSTVKGDVEAWMLPVKETMVAEELANLDVRAYERAQFASAFFDSSAGSLLILDDYMAQMAAGGLAHGEPRVTHFSPASMCPSALIATDGVGSHISCTPLARVPNQRAAGSYQQNYEASVRYRPSTPLPGAVKDVFLQSSGASTAASLAPDDASTAYNVAALDAWVQEQLLTSQLDHALTALYFSSNVSSVYGGFHATETYFEFPYNDLSSYAGSRTCDSFPNQAIGAYTPVCRPWYKEGVDAKGNLTYGSVLDNAVQPGTMFLPLTKAVKAPTGELIGVASVGVALDALADQVGAYQGCSIPQSEATCAYRGGTRSSNLYSRGYAMIWDAQGNGVVHKNYAKEENVNRGPLPIASLDAGGDGGFLEQFQSNVVDVGRTNGTWMYPWYNSEKGADENWFYSFRPIPNTPYMIALTVVQDEVTAEADAARERMRESVNTAMLQSIGICFLITAALVAFTYWLNRRFAKPVLNLLTLVRGWSRRSFAGNIDAYEASQASSRDLSSLMSNFKKMLIALRFGDSTWANGDVEAVMMNNFSALQMVEEAGSQRGVGVAMNNIANLAGNEQVQVQFPQLDHQEIYLAAIDAAKAQLAASPNEVANVESLAFRLLNFALWHMRATPPRSQEAASVLQEVMQFCTNARTMATVASHISSQMLASGSGPSDTDTVAHDPLIRQAVVNLVDCALNMCAARPIPFDDSDLVADLAVAHCDIGCMAGVQSNFYFSTPQELAMWALMNVPTILPNTLTRLCLHAKAGAPDDFVTFIDTVAGQKKNGGVPGPVLDGDAAARWRKSQGAVAHKAMMFVLDLSYSMQEDNRLGTCKVSLKRILTNSVKAGDRAGLISFATDVRTEFELGEVGEPSSQERTNKMMIVNRLQTRGMTAFYSAVYAGAKSLRDQLIEEPHTPKWLVALTDGADNSSDRSDIARAVKIFESTPHLHVALITVGTGIDMRVCNMFLAAASKGGNQSMLVKASNQADISKAFEQVSKAMSTGVSEAL